MSVYYNENDPKAAAWLRELIKLPELAAEFIMAYLEAKGETC